MNRSGGFFNYVHCMYVHNLFSASYVLCPRCRLVIRPSIHGIGGGAT